MRLDRCLNVMIIIKGENMMSGDTNTRKWDKDVNLKEVMELLWDIMNEYNDDEDTDFNDGAIVGIGYARRRLVEKYA